MMLEEEIEFSDDEEEGSSFPVSPPRPIIPARLDATLLPSIETIIPANHEMPKKLGFSGSVTASDHHARTGDIARFPTTQSDAAKQDPKLNDHLNLKLPASSVQALVDMAHAFSDQGKLHELVLLHSQCACAGSDYSTAQDKSFMLCLKLLRKGPMRRGSLSTLACIVLVSHKQVSRIDTDDPKKKDRYWEKKYMSQALALLGGVQEGLDAFGRQCAKENQHQYAMASFLLQATILRGRVRQEQQVGLETSMEELVQLGKTCADCNYPALAATCFRSAIGLDTTASISFSNVDRQSRKDEHKFHLVDAPIDALSDMVISASFYKTTVPQLLTPKHVASLVHLDVSATLTTSSSSTMCDVSASTLRMSEVVMLAYLLRANASLKTVKLWKKGIKLPIQILRGNSKAQKQNSNQIEERPSRQEQESPVAEDGGEQTGAENPGGAAGANDEAGAGSGAPSTPVQAHIQEDVPMKAEDVVGTTIEEKRYQPQKRRATTTDQAGHGDHAGSGHATQHDTTIDLGLPGRRGMLQKESVYLKWWRLRFFVLDPVERQIRIYVDETMKVNKGVVHLADITGVERAPRRTYSRLSFVIKVLKQGVEEEIYLCAKTAEDMEEWIDVIRANTNEDRLRMIDAAFIGAMLKYNTKTSVLKLHAVSLPVQKLRGATRRDMILRNKDPSIASVGDPVEISTYLSNPLPLPSDPLQLVSSPSSPIPQLSPTACSTCPSTSPSLASPDTATPVSSSDAPSLSEGPLLSSSVESILEFLDLSDSRLHPMDFRIIEELVTGNNELQHLVVTGARIPVGAIRSANARNDSILSAFCDPATISPTTIMPNVVVSASTAIGPGSGKKLSLRHQKLTPVDTSLIGRLLRNSQLTELALEGNSISAEGVLVLSWGLWGNSHIATLNLDNNNITSRGMRHICYALRQNLSLRRLHISNNNLGAFSAQLLADLLLVNDSITHLDVSSNHLIRAETSGQSAASTTTTELGNANAGEYNRDEDAVAYAGVSVPFPNGSSAATINFSEAVAKWSGIDLAEEDVNCRDRASTEGSTFRARESDFRGRPIFMAHEDNRRGQEVDLNGLSNMLSALVTNVGLTSLDISAAGLGSFVREIDLCTLSQWTQEQQEINENGQAVVHQESERIAHERQVYPTSPETLDHAEARLPMYWIKQIDPRGNVFYQNMRTHQIQEERPVTLAAVYDTTIEAGDAKGVDYKSVDVDKANKNLLVVTGPQESLEVSTDGENLKEKTPPSTMARQICQSFAEVFYTNRILTNLDIDDNGFSDQDACSGLTEIALALRDNNTITSLNGICVDAERECSFDGLQLHESMFVWLRLSASSVAVLDMSKNNLCLMHPGYWIQGLSALATALRNPSTTMVRLSLSETCLTGPPEAPHGERDFSGIAILCQSLYDNQVLQELDLSKNFLCADGCKFVANMMSFNVSIISLDLSSNSITVGTTVGVCTDGVEALASAVSQNNVLGALDISSNGLCGIPTGPQPKEHTSSSANELICMSLIVRAVQENNVVNLLDVSDNAIGRIGDEGAGIVDLICKALKNSWLLNIRMGRNSLLPELQHKLKKLAGERVHF